MSNINSAAATGLPELTVHTPPVAPAPKLDFDPQQHNMHVLTRLRREVKDEIERLLAFLDLIDADPEAEPSLGAPECHPNMWQTGPDGDGRHFERNGSQEHWAKGSSQEGEELDNSDFEANGDDELTLGAPESHPTIRGWGDTKTGCQLNWSKGDNIASRDDCELDTSDYEPDADGEDWWQTLPTYAGLFSPVIGERS